MSTSNRFREDSSAYGAEGGGSTWIGMTWAKEVRVLWGSISQEMLATKRSGEKIGPAKATLVGVYLSELLKHKQDPALSAVDKDFPSEMSLGDAKSLLDLMNAYWSGQYDTPLVSTCDPLDI